MFWYVISCAIVTMRDSFIVSESGIKNRKKDEKNAIIYLIIIFSALAIIGGFATFYI